MQPRILEYRRIIIALSQAFLLLVAYFLSFFLRFDLSLPEPAVSRHQCELLLREGLVLLVDRSGKREYHTKIPTLSDLEDAMKKLK